MSFDQESFNVAGDTDSESQEGEVLVDTSTLLSNEGASSGFLNITTSNGWVVQNLPVSADEGGLVSTGFELPVSDGTTDSSLNANVTFSAAPILSDSAAPSTSFSVGQDSYDAAGFGGGTASGTVAPTAPNAVSFTLGGSTTLAYELNHPNVQAATNQCGSAAAANNLQWLSNTYGITLTQTGTDAPGLKGDNTLVGQLDTTMNRTAPNRTTGGGVQGVPQTTGVLQYLANSNIGNVAVLNQGTNTDGTAAGGNLAAGGLTSQGQGNTLKFSFIQSQIQANQALQVGFVYDIGGAHMVDITGAGTILGVPWVTYVSDLQQTNIDPTDKLGTNQVNFSFLNNNLQLVDNGAKATAVFGLAEDVVPEPSTLGYTLVGLAGLAFFAWRRTGRQDGRQSA